MTLCAALLRDLGRWVGMGALGLSSLLGAPCAQAAQGAPAFGLDDVARLAAARAARPWQAPARTDDVLAELSYDQYRDIRFRSERSLWARQGLPFQARFFHTGRGMAAVRLHEVLPQGVRALPYRASDYDFGRNHRPPPGHGGHAGFRLSSELHQPGVQDELVAFLGASYFRAIGQGQRYGLSARGLALDTPGAEEFPQFTDFWLERPAPQARSVRWWALLDSPRVTGAYAFELRPGSSTEIEVRAALFLRATERPIQTLGIAPLTSMFFFGENQPQPGDFRPEVHDSDGLMVAAADGEWLWRPLNNPRTPQLSRLAFPAGIRGFGLMQRDRRFASYEDTEARYELRPSAWVTPLGDWGPGRVELYQFHTPDETHDNVVAYWVPDRLPAPGTRLDLAYRIAWQGQAQTRPPGGWAEQSRLGIGYLSPQAGAREQQLQYVVDFTGGALGELPEGAPVEAVAWASGARVLEALAYRHPLSPTWRMTLRLERPEPPQPIELRAFLRHGRDVLTETWTTLTTP